MSYQKKTIIETLEDINSGKMFLPAIQRKYVWGESQIVRLMDSILLNYPIGTFLYWNVKGETINEKQYSLYEFIKNYHERDFYINEHAPNPITKDQITAVLDGQQRLTSLYIALQGSLSMKLPMKRWNNDEAFPKKELFMNLKCNNSSDDGELTYEFAFLTKKEIERKDTEKLWYKVKDILTYKTTEDVMVSLVSSNGWNDPTIMKNILALHRSLVTAEIINYFEVKKESIDDVLDIFIRVNSGGTVLSKTDLLFSTVISHWDKARDEMEDLLKIINSIGEKYKFTNDFIMRSCLYLLELSINLKVENFKRDSVLKIKIKWPEIRTAIIDTVKLLDEFGFNSENIISYVAISPIVYYKYNGGEFDTSSKKELKKYFVIAQVKQIFGAASNSALTLIRDVLREKPKEFKLSTLSGIRFTGDRNLRFSESELASLFELEIGAYTFMILSLLYPNVKYSQKDFHQDHMHAQALFNDKSLADLSIDKDKREEWQKSKNKLANLQILEGRENESKNKSPLLEWLKDSKNSENVKYLPKNVSYELKEFEKFMIERQKLMTEELTDIFLGSTLT